MGIGCRCPEASVLTTSLTLNPTKAAATTALHVLGMTLRKPTSFQLCSPQLRRTHLFPF